MSESTHTRRDFLKLAGLGAAAAMLPSTPLFAEEKRKPNVIVILADDMGWAEMGTQGCKDVPTPNLDAIAKNGVRFTDGYVSCPVCSPTRAGLMTGRYQTRFGHEGNPGPGMDNKAWGLPLDQKTIANYMKDLGYATGAIGKWHLGDNAEHHPNKRGFDEFFGFIGGAHPYLDPTTNSFNTIQRNGKPVDEKDHLTYAFGREAVSFIGSHKDKPFFLYLAFNAVHAPLQRPRRLQNAFPEIKDEKRRSFATLLSSMDEMVGAVVKKVTDEKLEKDTLIIFLSDNGGPTPGTTSSNLPFKGFKTQVHEGGIRIPYMVQWVGHVPAGKTYSKPLISLDILPTAVAVAGGKVDHRVEGVNMLPYITGKNEETPHDTLYWKFDKQWAIRKGDWKLSRHETKGVRLYNLKEDPSEKNDRSGDYAEKVSQLTAAWNEWDAKNINKLWPCKADAPWTDETW